MQTVDAYGSGQKMEVTCATTMQGKRNQHGKKEILAITRHNDVAACSVNAIFFHLFYQYECDNQPPPDLKTSANWYSDLMFPGNANVKNIEMSRQNHAKNVDKCLAALSIETSKSTHSGRAGGGCYGMKNNVSMDQMRLLGRWNQDVMTNVYLKVLPTEAVLGLAGFDAKRPESYRLKRALVDPPEALQKMIWPWVDDYLSAFESPTCTFVTTENTTITVQKNIAAHSFLKWLKHGRKVILQDAVIMKAKYPRHNLWSHSVFNSASFADFAHQLTSAISSDEAPTYESVTLFSPLVASVLRDVECQSRTQHNIQVANYDIISEKLDNLIRSVSFISPHINKILQFNTDLSRYVQNSLSNMVSAFPAFPGFPPFPPLVQNENSIINNANNAPVQPTSLPLSNNDISTSSLLPPSVYSDYLNHNPNFEVLCKEWFIGLDGKRSVEDLEQTFGTNWRKHDPNLMRRYGRKRLVIVQFKRKAETFDEDIIEFARRVDTMNAAKDKLTTINKCSYDYSVDTTFDEWYNTLGIDFDMEV